jgi:hypothetical protein
MEFDFKLKSLEKETGQYSPWAESGQPKNWLGCFQIEEQGRHAWGGWPAAMVIHLASRRWGRVGAWC